MRTIATVNMPDGTCRRLECFTPVEAAIWIIAQYFSVSPLKWQKVSYEIGILGI